MIQELTFLLTKKVKKAAVVPLREEELHLVAITSRRNLTNHACFWDIKCHLGTKDDKSLETETRYDLALLYLCVSQWRDAEVCVSKIRTIRPYSALAWHATGKLYEAKGQPKEALGSYFRALDLDHKHVPSLTSTATVLSEVGDRPLPSV